jgi:hypothetical protein
MFFFGYLLSRLPPLDPLKQPDLQFLRRRADRINFESFRSDGDLDFHKRRVGRETAQQHMTAFKFEIHVQLTPRLLVLADRELRRIWEEMLDKHQQASRTPNDQVKDEAEVILRAISRVMRWKGSSPRETARSIDQ